MAGCGFQPLYGPTASGSRLSEVMSSVEITPIPGRVGQRLRNELIFDNTGGNTAAPSRYRLDIVVKESVSNQNIRLSGDATAQTYQLNATFKLVNLADGKVMLEGEATSHAAFERFQQIYSNVRARYRCGKPSRDHRRRKHQGPPCRLLVERGLSRPYTHLLLPWSPIRPHRFSAS